MQRYQLKHKLAEGGMAQVFLARERGVEGFERLVVIKRILPQLSSDPEFVRMFTNEARVLARLSHPNVVQVYELGSLDGQYFIAMEFVYGADLRRVRQRLEELGRPAPLGFACRVVADVLAGLRYVHAQRGPRGEALGLVHRDVTPSNVLVSYEGAVKLVDFGIVKSTLLLTQPWQTKGKFAYMAPEQVRGEALDGRCDVFACGILLWELVRGAPLFKRPSVEGTVDAVLGDAVPPLGAYDAALPPGLDAIVARALCRPLDARYPSAEAMLEDLERLIREQRLEADGLSMRRLMRELFAAVIERQDHEVQQAGHTSVIEYLLAEDDSAVVWLDDATARRPSADAEPTATAPARKRAAAPPDPEELRSTEPDGALPASLAAVAAAAEEAPATERRHLDDLPAVARQAIALDAEADDATPLGSGAATVPRRWRRARDAPRGWLFVLGALAAATLLAGITYLLLAH